MDEVPNAEEPWGIGVSLSGGGHRSTLFSLGVLLALVEAGWHREVRSISSVSGGSLANAFVWSRGEFREAEPDQFGRWVQAAMAAVERGSVCGSTRAKLRFGGWLLGIACLLVLALASVSTETPFVPHWLGLAVIATGVALLVRVRGRIVEANLEELWFDSASALRTEFAGTPRAGDIEFELDKWLADRDQPTLHVIVATDLISGEPIYLTQGSVIVGDGMAWPLTSIPLVRAVRASLSVPGLLPPVRARLGNLVQGGADLSATRDRRLHMVDGGVFNNLGTDWDLTGRRAVRSADYLVLHASHNIAPAFRVIVDAGADSVLRPSRIASLPIVGSIANLARAMRVSFRSGLYGRRITDVHGQDAARFAVQCGHVDFRAVWTLPEEMKMTRKFWSHVARRSRATPTTLRSVSRSDCACLVAHGYREAASALTEHGAIGIGMAWEQWLKAAAISAVPSAIAGHGGFPT